MFKRFGKGLQTCLLLIVIIAVSACGSAGSGNSTGESKPANSESTGNTGNTKAGNSGAEKVQLRISWAGSQSRHDATLKALEVYTELNPHVTFEPDYMGFDTYYTKLATYSAAKNLPDILQIDTNYLLDYALRGQLLDLSEGIDLSDVDPSLLGAGMSNGIQYGIPIGANAIALHYNKVMFDKLGIVVPENGFTWEELIELAREVKPKLESGQYLIQDFSISKDSTELDKYEIYQLAQGKGQPYNPDGTFNIDKETFIEFSELFAQLREEGIVPPVDVSMANKENDPILDNLLNGTILVARGYAASLGAIDGVNPGQYGLMPAPSAAQSGTYLLPSQFFAVAENTPHAEEAKKFIDWFINDVQAGEALGLSRGPQVSKKLADALSDTYNDVEQQQVEYIELAKKIASPFNSKPKGYGNFQVEYNKISQQIGFAQITPEEGYELLRKAWTDTVGD